MPPAGARLPVMRAGALQYVGFRRYLAAQGVSLLGTWMQSAAQAWLVLELTGSAVRLGTVSAVQFLPVLVFSLVAGALADRVDRLRFLAACEAVLAALALALGLLTVSGRVQYWHVVLMAGLYGIANTFDMPTRQALLSDLVPREHLASAISLHSTAFNVARLVGPAVAGLTVAAVGTGVAFVLNALSFVPVIGVLWWLRRMPRPRPAEGRAWVEEAAHLLASIREGLAYIRRGSAMRRSLWLLGIVSLFSMNFQVLVPVYAQRVLHQEASGYGFLMSSVGVGALLAAVGLAASSQVEPAPWRRSLGVVLIGAASLGLAGVRGYAPATLLFAAAGWGMVSLSVGTNALLQLATDPAFRGRVMSVFTLVLVGVTPLGSVLSGALADHLGVRVALAAGGLVALTAWALVRPWRIRATRPAAGPAGGSREQAALRAGAGRC